MFAAPVGAAQTVRASRNARHRHRLDQLAASGAVAGIDNNRQMRKLLDERDGIEIEREARGRVEAADTSFAEDDPIVATRQHVLSRHQPLLDGG